MLKELRSFMKQRIDTVKKFLILVIEEKICKWKKSFEEFNKFI